MKHTGVLLGLFATVGLACTASGVPGLHGFEADGGGTTSSSGSSSGSNSGGSGGSSSGGSSGYGASSSGTSSGAPGDDAGPAADDGGVPPGDDSSTPPPPVDSGFQFNFPDTGFGGSSSSSGGSTDGGSPCHGQNKLCIDPVFDCILQGCGLNSACVGAVCQ